MCCPYALSWVWLPYKGAKLLRKLTFLPQNPSTVNSSSVKDRAYEPLAPSRLKYWHLNLVQTATVISSGSQSCLRRALFREIQSQFDTTSNNMVSIRLTPGLMKSSITSSWSDSLYWPSVCSYGAGLKANQKVTPIISLPLLDPWAYPAKPVIVVQWSSRLGNAVNHPTPAA